MKIKPQFLRRMALLLAVLTLASAVLAGCGKKDEADTPLPE